MQRTNVDVGTCIAAAGVDTQAGAVNTAPGVAEADVLMSAGACKQKDVRRRTRRCRCSFDPAGHTDVVDAELELAVADADSVGPDANSWSYRALRTLTSR